MSERVETVIVGGGQAGLATSYHLNGDGYPVGKRGVTQYPGLYFIGMPWLYKWKSGLLFGVGDDAAFVASTIMER